MTLQEAQQRQEPLRGSEVTTITSAPPPPAIVLNDGTGYHPQLWLSGRTIPDGSGPYLPQWQVSPINDEKQSVLNSDLSKTPLFRQTIPILQAYHQAVVSLSVVPEPEYQESFAKNIRISQHRQDVEVLTLEPVAFLTVPVFDRLPFHIAQEQNNTNSKNEAAPDGTIRNETKPDDERRLAGALFGNLY